MDIATQAAKAAKLRQLHHGPRILILPNAWDAISARILEDAGFPAVATTSAGMAAALGYPDGQRVPPGEMLEAVARIARAVSVPVTADLEAGYGTSPGELADFARAVVQSGAVGLNLEDVTGDDESSEVPLALQVEKIMAVREASAAAGVPLVINARTDIYLMPVGPEETRFQRTVDRLRAYREAGASCLFAPGIRDAETIGRLVKALEAPLNILLQPGGPTVRELEKLGVARASAGSGPHRVALTALREAAIALRDYGDHTPFFRDAITWSEVNRLLGREA
ncbi:MAG TPA: isocitrate lyase/phosphoenolpyruvate mutase family protein [Dongiaceae bacterium]|nr:isocitrate lyase/phosphoenolpyruvate mutase family protein [Dongiaceae bacterium]